MLGVVCGVSVNSPYVWANRARIVEMRYDKNHRGATPMVMCKANGCDNKVALVNTRYRKSSKAGHCFLHSRQLRRKRPFEAAYNGFIRKGPRRKHAISLSYSEFAELCSKENCHYCGARLARNPYAAGGYTADAIDRMDPTLGYTAENCVPCCAPCNFTKNATMTYDEMLILGALRAGNRVQALALVEKLDLKANQQQQIKFYGFVWARDAQGGVTRRRAEAQ